MNPQTVGIVGFIAMVAAIFLRMPVAIALGIVGTWATRCSMAGIRPCRCSAACR